MEGKKNYIISFGPRKPNFSPKPKNGHSLDGCNSGEQSGVAERQWVEMEMKGKEGQIRHLKKKKGQNPRSSPTYK